MKLTCRVKIEWFLISSKYLAYTDKYITLLYSQKYEIICGKIYFGCFHYESNITFIESCGFRNSISNWKVLENIFCVEILGQVKRLLKIMICLCLNHSRNNGQQGQLCNFGGVWSMIASPCSCFKLKKRWRCTLC